MVGKGPNNREEDTLLTAYLCQVLRKLAPLAQPLPTSYHDSNFQGKEAEFPRD